MCTETLYPKCTNTTVSAFALGANAEITRTHSALVYFLHGGLEHLRS